MAWVHVERKCRGGVMKKTYPTLNAPKYATIPAYLRKSRYPKWGWMVTLENLKDDTND